MKTIQATIVYLSIEGGFWGLVDEQGHKWLPLNMPEQLKVEGANVFLTIREHPGTPTSQMWGTPVEILSFPTLGVAHN